MLTISVVSHGQARLVADLLRDIGHCCGSTPLHVVLTLNMEESLPFGNADFPFKIEVIRNSERRGFGANHNTAFRRARGDHFCVLNPDIRLEQDPFPLLLEQLADSATGVAGPLIVNPAGGIEDSARKFPTLLSIAKKVLGAGSRLDYEIGDSPFNPDWVAGMFMLFRSSAFARAGGFDERYFMYYEDVDLCVRLRRIGFDVRLVPSVRVVHRARRESHRNPRYLWWHLTSMLRFLRLHGSLPVIARLGAADNGSK